MSLVDLCVRRPVFATMLIVALVVLGLASYRDLGLDIFPKVDIPTVTVTTRLPGASPEEVESQVTKRIEEVVDTISGIDELEKVATILSQLPQGTEAPVVEKFDFDAAPVLALVVSGRRSPREITVLADKRIKRAPAGVKDIGAVTLVGQRKREILIAVDPSRLAAYGLSIQQVQTALQRQNVEVPGGRLTGEGREEELPRRLLAWQPTWRPALGQRLATGLNGGREA